VNVHARPTSEPANRDVREDHGVPGQGMTGLFERLQAFRLDRAGNKAAMRLAHAGLMGAGVTAVVDLTAPFEGWMEVMREAGLRVWLGPGDASARWGMSAPQTVTWQWDEARGRAGFQRAQAVMDEAEADPSCLLHGIVFPARIDTVEEGLLRDSAALAAGKGRPFTTHIAHAVVEVREMIRRHGMTPIQWAERIGILGPTSILGHAILIDDHPSIGWHTARDLALMAERGVAVAHCPSPFARCGEHLRHFGRHRARGVRMAMGTDVAPHNPIGEMQLAIPLARGVARDPLRSLVFHAADRAVRHVFVAGRQVLRDGRPTMLDVAEAAGILAESQARMLRDPGLHDCAGRSGETIAPLFLPSS